MADLTAAEFRAAALELKAADRSLMLLTRKNLRLATAPAAEAVRRSALATLPKRGGLNSWVADTTIKTGILTGPRSAGVRIVARKTGHDLASINNGTVRHPLYGNTNYWYSEPVVPGFFTRPLEAMSVEVTAALVETMNEAGRVAGFTP